MDLKTIRSVLIGVFCLILLSTGSASGAGFALIEQGVSGLGNSFAGGSASAQDATTVFFNPAGMTKIPTQSVAAANLIVPNFTFRNEGSTHRTDPALRGNNGGDAGVAKVTPNLYYVQKIDRLAVGIGINAPFGLATKYDNRWVGRYHAIESDLSNININPSVAYRVNEKFSVGGGINIGYVKAILTNAVDFGSFIGSAQNADGFVKLKGDAWGAGWNVGLLYEFTKDTRVGAAYRSKVRYTLEGNAKFYNVPAALAGLPNFKNDDINAHLTTPDSLSVSFFHSFNPKWSIMGDVTWTNWSTFDELRIRFDNGRTDSVVTTEWREVFRYSLGATFTPNKAWTLRAGTAYDQAPVPSDRRRTARIPDADRLWLSLGAGYGFTDALTFNVACAHLFINDTKITKSTADPEDNRRGGLLGTYSGSVNIISAELKWVF
ncbi:MAG: outer membrane protein transport protein [Syntrophorhabdaceae bacterium]|nr:outer membrane protein transport protein [Syntrophorhabdaceae bacterium]